MFKGLYRKAKNRLARYFYESVAEENLVDFANMSSGSMDQALKENLPAIRNRSRWELKNNSTARAIPTTYSNVAIARGPVRVAVKHDNKNYALKVSAMFSSYLKSCGSKGESVGRLLHLGTREMFPAGEFFLVTKSKKNKKGLPELKFQIIQPERVTNSGNINFTNQNANGIETDSDGNAVAYWVSDKKKNGIISPVARRIPADNVIHVYVTDEPEQTRGQPWMCTNVKELNKIRAWDKGVLAVQAIAAFFGVYVKNDNENSKGRSAKPLNPSIREMNPGNITTLPYKHDVATVQANQPTNDQNNFRKEIQGEIGAANQIPINLTRKNSADYNFASARVDVSILMMDTTVYQQLLEENCINRIFELWLEEAVAMGMVAAPHGEVELDVLWSKPDFHTDPSKLAKANEVYLKTGQRSWSEVRAEAGLPNGPAALEGLMQEVVAFNEKGLIHPYQLEQGESNAEEEKADEKAEEAAEALADEK